MFGALFRRRKVVSEEPPLKLHHLAMRMDDLEEKVDHLRGALIRLRGRITGGERTGSQDPPAQDAPGATIDREEVSQYPPRAGPPRSAHLSKRFKIGG